MCIRTTIVFCMKLMGGSVILCIGVTDRTSQKEIGSRGIDWLREAFARYEYYYVSTNLVSLRLAAIDHVSRGEILL